MPMTVLHVDMDAFFAAVEQRDHPEWRGKPVIVGSGPHERGVVSTCSYEARKFGVRSAMPSRTAYAKCPHGIFVKPRMHVYSEVSKTAFEVFAKYSPFVEGVSVDEAFLDISGTAHLFGGMVPLAEKLRADIKSACGVTCSVGLAPNRLLAKLGSEQNKPDGLFVMPFDPDGIREFLAPKAAKRPRCLNATDTAPAPISRMSIRVFLNASSGSPPPYQSATTHSESTTQLSPAKMNLKNPSRGSTRSLPTRETVNRSARRSLNLSKMSDVASERKSAGRGPQN